MKNTEIVDADRLASAAGVSRRTVMRAAQRAGAAVYIGNKGFVRKDAVNEVLGDRYTPVVAKTGAHNAARPHTLQEVADRLGCSRSTVLRVLRRNSLGVTIGNRRYVPADQVRAVKAGILAAGVNLVQLDPKRMTAHARRMAAASARVRRKAAKIRRSKMAANAG